MAKVLPDLPPEAKGGAWVGLGWLGLVLLRKVGLRASKDMITVQADSSDRDAFSRLQKRVAQLDERLGELEAARNYMFGFATKCMAFIAQCQCAGVMPPTKAELQADYEKLIEALAHGFTKKQPGKGEE